MSVLLHSFDALSSTILYAAPPNPPAQAPPGLDTFTTKVLGWLKWGTGIAAMGGLLAPLLPSKAPRPQLRPGRHRRRQPRPGRQGVATVQARTNPTIRTT